MINEMFLVGLGCGTTVGGLVGVFFGRKVEQPNSYGAGVVTGRMMAEYQADQEQMNVRSQQAAAHGHRPNEYCTAECYQRKS